MTKDPTKEVLEEPNSNFLNCDTTPPTDASICKMDSWDSWQNTSQWLKHIVRGLWGGVGRGYCYYQQPTQNQWHQLVQHVLTQTQNQTHNWEKHCPETKNDILNKRTDVVTINNPHRTSDPSFCNKTRLNKMKHSQMQMSTTFFSWFHTSGSGLEFGYIDVRDEDEGEEPTLLISASYCYLDLL